MHATTGNLHCSVAKPMHSRQLAKLHGRHVQAVGRHGLNAASYMHVSEKPVKSLHLELAMFGCMVNAWWAYR